MNIIGVDFSGAKREGNDPDKWKTWVSEGVLEGDHLTVTRCFPTTRPKLKRFLLSKGRGGAMVAAMDFPFSVPKPFAEFWEREKGAKFDTMPDLWRAARQLEYKQFQKLRDAFVQRHGELLRSGDVHFGGPFSPLKTGGPNMLPMTFRGMKMLHWLCGTGTPRFYVPPLPKPGPNSDSRTLLEVMPGVLLRNFGLPAQNYKNPNKTNGGHPEQVRKEILDGLQNICCLSMGFSNVRRDRQKCIDNDDCLDSLVAAIGAALWAQDGSQYPSRFLHPRQNTAPNEEIKAAQLEGWLYGLKPQP